MTRTATIVIPIVAGFGLYAATSPNLPTPTLCLIVAVVIVGGLIIWAADMHRAAVETRKERETH